MSKIEIRAVRDEVKRETVVNGVPFSVEQQMVVEQILYNKDLEINGLKDHIYDLNNKLLNLQLFLKNLRNFYPQEHIVYREIDKKLKELGGGDE